MKKVKKKAKNKSIDTLKELYNILGFDYFHICISYNGDDMQWDIFYKNLDDKEYFSKENPVLLTSKENGIADVYALKDRFKRAKEDVKRKNALSIIKESFTLYQKLYETKKQGIDGMLNLYMLYTAIGLIMGLFLENILYSFINLWACIAGGIYLIYKQKRFNKFLDQKKEEIVEIVLRNIIKKQGLNFVERIKENENNRN